MRLILEKVWVDDLIFGDSSGIHGTTLTVNKEEIIERVRQDKRIARVNIDIVKPGESARLFSVRDVIEPRIKVRGTGELFPGMFGNAKKVGEGITKALKGSAVITVGKVDGVKEGIIDMAGPGAAYTPFSKTNNLVLECDPIPGLESEQYEEALRLAGLKIARYIAGKCKEAIPQEKTIYETEPIEKQKQMYPNLPKVGYVYMLQSQGLRHDTYVYGVDAKTISPRLMYATEVMDGAIVSSNILIASDKNTTYHHLNNPIIEDLFACHGRTINFCGVIITNQNVTLEDKNKFTDETAELVEQLGLDGVIISKEEYGNTDTDLMMNCRKIEERGIKTVLITDEYAGRDGTSQSLADADSKADAVVSTGNANETIILSPMDKVIGEVELWDQADNTVEGRSKEGRKMEVEIQSIIGATNELGFNKMGTR